MERSIGNENLTIWWKGLITLEADVKKRIKKFREVDQLVDRVVWDHQAAGSSPVFPTEIKLN